jgi:hypothetical protein
MAKPDSAKRDMTARTYMFMSQTKIARFIWPAGFAAIARRIKIDDIDDRDRQFHK